MGLFESIRNYRKRKAGQRLLSQAFSSRTGVCPSLREKPAELLAELTPFTELRVL